MALPEIKQQTQTARHHFTVEEYLALSDMGVLPEHTELIEGDIYDMAAHSTRHRAVVKMVSDQLTVVFKNRATVFAQSTLAFEGWSPEPDIMLLKFDASLYRDRQPLTEEIHLIIEVSDTTLVKDKGIKLRSYALQGILEYWIINLVDDVTEIYRHPRGEDFDEKVTVSFSDKIAPLAFPNDAQVWLELL